MAKLDERAKLIDAVVCAAGNITLKLGNSQGIKQRVHKERTSRR
jgi:hypothetical protein